MAADSFGFDGRVGVGLEVVAHLRAGAADAGADGADRGVHHDSDLAVRELLDGEQDQRFSIGREQPVERLLQDREAQTGVELVVNSRDLVGPTRFRQPRPRPLGTLTVAQVPAQHIVGDAVEPGANGAASRVESGPSVERDPEHLAGQIIGATAAEATGKVGMDRDVVAVEDLPESGRVAINGCHDLVVARVHIWLLSDVARSVLDGRVEG